MAKIVAITEHTGPGKAIREVVKTLREESGIETSLYPTALTSNLYRDLPELKELSEEQVSTLRGEHMSPESLDSFVQSIFEEEKPDLILTASIDPSPAIDKSMIREANKRDILSIAVMDYWSSPDLYGKRFPSKEFYPTKIASLDDIDTENLILSGIPKDIIVITGNPNFDGLKMARRAFEGKEKAFRPFDLSPTNILVTYAPDPLHSDFLPFDEAYKINRDTFDSMACGLSRVSMDNRKKVDLAVMLHPKDIRAEGGIDSWKEIFKLNQAGYVNSFLGRESMEDTRVNLDNARLSSNLVMSGRSTSGAECLYLGSPVMILHPGLEFYRNGLNHFIEKGIIPAANSIESGIDQIYRFFSNSKFRENCLGRQEVYKNQPDSSPRVVELIKSML